jgi:aminoglycoside phosphotransferase family enzyme/predicted kinase
MTALSDSQVSNSQTMVDALCSPSAYPHKVTEVRIRETHISWILLTGEFAYKIKKPLDLGFLDFSSLESRRDACHEELRLNRRMAAPIYLDVVPITGSFGRPQFQGSGSVLDYAVKMIQFPDDAVLDEQLESGRLTISDMEQLAETLADFHQKLEPADPLAEFGTPEAIWQPVAENFRHLDELRCDADMDTQLSRLQTASRQLHSELAGRFIKRRQAGHIRECHGDFHLGNLVRLPGGITGFDALEFDPALRWIDVFSEVAFLIMDLEVRGQSELAYRFLNRYLQLTGDYDGLHVLHYYVAYRALVRAKVRLIRDRELFDKSGLSPVDDPEIIALLELATRHLNNNHPVLIITMGLSGSGKTTIAAPLSDSYPAIHIRSDMERKRLHGFDELARTHSGVARGIYAPDASATSYAHLAELARLALQAGFSVVVDAACLRRDQRTTLLTVAEQQNCPAVILHLVADTPLLAQRIQAREAAGRDASEANPAVLDYQLENQQPLSGNEQDQCIRIDTADQFDNQSLVSEIRRAIESR